MNKEEFIGKLEMVYVGDRNAFNEIVEDNQRLKNEVVYSKVEIDRLNNIINELEKFLNKVVETGSSIEQITCKNIFNYLQELKENK